MWWLAQFSPFLTFHAPFTKHYLAHFSIPLLGSFPQKCIELKEWAFWLYLIWVEPDNNYKDYQLTPSSVLLALCVLLLSNGLPGYKIVPPSICSSCWPTATSASVLQSSRCHSTWFALIPICFSLHVRSTIHLSMFLSLAFSFCSIFLVSVYVSAPFIIAGSMHYAGVKESRREFTIHDIASPAFSWLTIQSQFLTLSYLFRMCVFVPDKSL